MTACKGEHGTKFPYGESYRESLERFHSLKYKRGTAWALINLAEVVQLQGNDNEAVRLSDEALSLQKTVSLDLEKVWFVDLRGVSLLRDLAKRQVSELNCSQFVSQQLKEATQ